MKTHGRSLLAPIASMLALCVSAPIHADSPAMPTASPESAGFDRKGLAALDSQMHALVDQQKLAGVVTLIARHGKVVHFDTYGKADAASGAPLKSDSIFRIASMTKPIAGVAMMQLHERGKWRLDDPVAKHIPEFANLRVKTGDGRTEAQKSPMTMAQLMSHSAGFGVSSVYAQADLGATDLQGMIDKLKALPLETQPGTAWDYGPSVNIQGYIIEKLSGQPLDVYLDEHIFKPLGMTDTGFWVSPEKATRVVSIHTYDAAGRIVVQNPQRITTAKPSFLAASGGLMSTASDYWRFSQALLNGGELEGKRILKPETVELMRTNVLQPGAKVDLYGPSQEGIGFGMDFAVVLDTAAAKTPMGLNSFYWGGAFGTWFWIDPTNDLVFVGMIQNLNGSTPTGGTPRVREISAAATYDALKK
ncbi:CubicO group peptidase (beta-lactamase class C family) [Povalibacter uvarum]|uniref:CubicO group peptidase (Beta-lactamase class C family) n=1 Tax=Povalibacter uvarum TaxID=732238 RepID=A0A841HP35_9GAMM|nr:serine hydrolase domain-containing protein [Povalibacter uvarum]MBB6093705.1 CubicO group peptidase (beta-lactamase class C family) [Povalibacter uvarum]